MNKNSKSYQDWLLKAENDLKAAEGIFGYYEQPPTDTICYHCHQVAEKSLKGYLVFQGIIFHKIHDLITLLNLSLTKDKTLDFLREYLDVLSQYYIETKYPLDTPIDYSKEEAKNAIDKARLIFRTIKGKIKSK
jgi:HEPN domain-containing protein